METETQEQTQTDSRQSSVELKPSAGTYLRYLGVVAADVVAVASIYQSFDVALAVVLSVAVVVLTVAAAWYNNSVTKGAIAADVMKDAFTDADNAESIKETWRALNETFHAVYNALKASKEGQ